MTSTWQMSSAGLSGWPAAPLSAGHAVAGARAEKSGGVTVSSNGDTTVTARRRHAAEVDRVGRAGGEARPEHGHRRRRGVQAPVGADRGHGRHDVCRGRLVDVLEERPRPGGGSTRHWSTSR